MVKRGEYNEEGELLYEYNDYWEDEGGYRTCGDAPCACERCSY